MINVKITPAFEILKIGQLHISSASQIFEKLQGELMVSLPSSKVYGRAFS